MNPLLKCLMVMFLLNQLAFAQTTWGDAAYLNTNAEVDAGGDSEPNLAVDSQGRWMAVWSSTDSRDDTVGTDFDIFGAVSTDNGLTWSPSFVINSAEMDSGLDFEPCVATDGNGRWVVVWRSNDPQGNFGSDYDIFYSISDDHGAGWTTPAAVSITASSDTGDEFFPSIASDGGNGWMCTWQSNDPNGNTGTDNDIFVATSADNAATWTTALLLNSDGESDSGQDNNPEVKTDGRGVWIIVWASQNMILARSGGLDRDIVFSRSQDFGTTWSDPAPINDYAFTDSANDTNPDLATDGAGNWLAVWSTDHDLGTNGTDNDVMFSRSIDSGVTWTSARAIEGTTDAVNDAVPRIHYGAGSWVTVWAGNNDPGDSGTDTDIYSSASTDMGLAWSTRTLVNDYALTDSANNFDNRPHLNYGDGRWLSVWSGSITNEDGDIVFALSPPAGCTIPDSFAPTVATWPSSVSILNLVQIINEACGLASALAKQDE
ncbi:sialidase family protein [Acanthopleuribacter pedis]|uniref:Exo-alpha-sialidase n=1 Tax=Acanthopleuribacter pedis TaxID=442870 RepID=A0A8J7QF53_9BACT|nr:sialidase family protein [Acanthopleuribacter pedis]MBO1317373.1 exo-alpha-sialidase [Acanthopleuribacter pedis]MBO1318680.1 exo-alpha-sialidase [Acanthopleuribacter pedis]